MNNLSAFIKYQRKNHRFSQQELALKAGVGIRFIRDLEQGKETLQLNKVEQVLQLFGYTLAPVKQKVDAYSVFWNYLNKGVKIMLSDKTIKYGVILQEIIDNNDQKIVAWKFLPNSNIIEYKNRTDSGLLETIIHNEILEIEKQ